LKHRYTAYFDGASVGNPGPSGIGGLIQDPDGNIVCEISQSIGQATNNEAEYKALIAVAEQLVHLGIDNVAIKGDSQLVVNQVNGEWNIKHDHLFRLCSRAENILENIPNWTLIWIPREKNQQADKLSSKAVATTNKPKNQFAGQVEQVNENIFLAYGTAVYAVDIKHDACTCPAFTSGKTKPCKHIIAVEAFAMDLLADTLQQERG
jgi:ribonuclease HI